MRPTIEWPSIDCRSFHVYHKEGQNFLFDRATESLSEVDDAFFVFFQELEAGATWNEAHIKYVSTGGEEPLDVLCGIIEEMISNGFFRFEPVDQALQSKLIDRLMVHHPRRLQLLMAQGCNLGCRYCYAWRNGSNQKNTLMSFEMAKTSVDHLIQRSGSRKNLQITFFGGEPLLNWEVLKEVVDYCRSVESSTDKSFIFEVITNCTLLTEDKSQFLRMRNFWSWLV